MSKNIKDIGKKLLGQSLNSFHRKTGLTQLEKNNEMQDGILNGIYSQIKADGYIEKTSQEDMIHLENSGDGVVELCGIEGNSIVNYSTLKDSIYTAETIEGESFITLEDTEDSRIYIDEIWGNTVQDENNLEDIQSIGELYVDEQGQPILDDLGREQYKLEIESCNYKRLYTNEEIVELYNNMDYSNVKAEYTQDGLFKLTNNGMWLNPNKVFKGNPNTEYTFYTPGITGIYTHGLTLVKKYSNDFYVYRTDSTGEFGYLIHGDIGIAFDFKIYEGNISNIENITEKSHKTTILLPCQLQKVGDVYDRLYWDSEKGRYVVEKKIGVTEFTNKNWSLSVNKEEVILFNKSQSSLGIEWDLSVVGKRNSSLCSILKWIDVNLISNSSGHRLLTNNRFAIQVLKTDLVSEDLKGFEDYLNTKKNILYYPLKTSQLIETNITEKILLPCYEDKTHIFVNSTVDATKIIGNGLQHNLTIPLETNTTYNIRFNCTKGTTSQDLQINLGGTTVTIPNSDIQEINELSITTGETISFEGIRFIGNVQISDLIVSKQELNCSRYFEGLQSSFEEKVNDECKYEIEILSNNKNLCKITEDYKLENANGLTLKYNKLGQYIEVNGTATSDLYLYNTTHNVYYDIEPLKAGTTYTCSLNIVGNVTSNSERSEIGYFSVNGNTIACRINNDKSITKIGNGEYSQYTPTWIRLNGGVTFSNCKIYLHLEKGVSISNYEPYKQNKIKLLINEPLRAIGDVKDRLCINNGKLAVERYCDVREYQEGDLDLENVLTDMTNTIYLLDEIFYEEVTNEYGEPIILEGYENGTLYIDSVIVPTTTVKYTPKMASFKTLKEVNNNNIMLTNDVNDNIIPYMMDVDLMIMEKEMALMSHKNIRKMEVLDMTSMQKRTQDMLERLIKGKTLTEQECKTRVTTYLHAGKITDEQAEELMLLIDEVYA